MRRFLAVSLMLTLVGCSGHESTLGFSVTPVIDPVTLSESSTIYTESGQVNIASDDFSALYLTASSQPVPAGNSAASKVTGLSQAQARNRLASFILISADRICEFHKSGIVRNQAALNMTLGSLTTVFSGVGAIAGAEAVKSVLAAAAGISNSTRSLVNEELYLKSFSAAITQAIGQSQDQKRASIKSGLSKPISEYSVDSMLIELIEYHNSCSFYQGLEQIMEALAEKRRNTETFDSQVRTAQLRLSLQQDEAQLAAGNLDSTVADSLRKAIEAKRQKLTALETGSGS